MVEIISVYLVGNVISLTSGILKKHKMIHARKNLTVHSLKSLAAQKPKNLHIERGYDRLQCEKLFSLVGNL